MTSTEERLQFVHFWTFEVLSTFSMRDSDNFATIYGSRVYEWCIRIDRGETFGFRTIENRGVELSIEPTMRVFNTRLPPNSTCTFHFNVYDRLTNKVLLQAGPQLCPLVDDPHGNRGYYLPQSSEAGVALERMLKGNDYYGHKCILTSTLCIPISAFSLEKIENLAPRPPSIPDYRFRMLTENPVITVTGNPPGYHQGYSSDLVDRAEVYCFENCFVRAKGYSPYLVDREICRLVTGFARERRLDRPVTGSLLTGFPNGNGELLLSWEYHIEVQTTWCKSEFVTWEQRSLWSRLDFTIRCRDGNILVAKEGVFLASEYFRNYLEAADHDDANFGDVNRQAVLIALTFAITGTMAPPEFLSPSMVNDIIDTARRLHALNFPKLRNALEEEAIQWAIKQNEDLPTMLSWFICSHQCGMPNLHMVCLAHIANTHATQYLQEYTDVSMVVSSSTADPEMAERLNRRQGILRPTPHQRIMTLIRCCSKVRPVARVEVHS